MLNTELPSTILTSMPLPPNRQQPPRQSILTACRAQTQAAMMTAMTIMSFNRSEGKLWSLKDNWWIYEQLSCIFWLQLDLETWIASTVINVKTYLLNVWKIILMVVLNCTLASSVACLCTVARDCQNNRSLLCRAQIRVSLIICIQLYLLKQIFINFWLFSNQVYLTIVLVVVLL